ncbi:hypothetical protein V8C44DRAFT_265306 [Trichoderma aethiopicum]
MTIGLLWPHAKELTMSLFSPRRRHSGQAEIASVRQDGACNRPSRVEDRATRSPCADSRAEAGGQDEELVAQS